MNTKLQNPYQNALIPVGLLAMFSLISSLAACGLNAAGVIKLYFFWISLFFFATISLTWCMIGLLGVRKLKRIRGFLNSSRPIIRWTYSLTEWRQIKENNWKEERQDWKIQWGCLGLLLGMAGLMTGAMLGLGEGFGVVLLWAFIGLIIGLGFGLMIGGLVAGGNHLSSWLTYRQAEPVQVVLGVGEIFNGYDYFFADGHLRLINNIELNRGNPDTLVYTLEFPPRPRMPLEETWIIPIPSQYVDQVSHILPLLKGTE